MGWHDGKHCKIVHPDTNSDWLQVKGELTQEEAGIWFTKFLAQNPYLALKFLCGSKLAAIHPIQDIIIRTWFQRDYNLLVAGRGFSKSYTAALFVTIYALFNPGVKIIICSASYRQAKMIFETIEKFINAPEAAFIRQCCPNWGKDGARGTNPSRGTDRYLMKIGKSEIMATPLTEKIRGYRAQLVIIDEYLSVPEKIVNEIIRPFMTVKRGNGPAQEKIKAAEQVLIDRGEMHEWQRTVFPNNKMIALSSATYKFEPLYKNTYETYLNSIHNLELNGKKLENISHSVFRLGYLLAPKGMLELNNIEEARRTLSSPQFDREYNAIFTDESGGFYNMQHILAATAQPGEEPKIRMKGRKNLEYIVAVDPNSSAGSDEADNFAISVIELAGDGSYRGALVHGYATAKSEVKKRVEYMNYIMRNFNVVFVILDNAGGPRFLEEYNSLVKSDEEKIFLADLDFTDEETLRMTRQNYNRQERKIAYAQVFNKKNWIRDANELMQGDIQHQRIIFASSIQFSSEETASAVALMSNVTVLDNKEPAELEFKQMSDVIRGEERRMEHVLHVDEIVKQTSKELALIEVKTDAVGNYTFDLPTQLKGSSGKDRARRDSYTSLLLGNFARHCWKRISEEDDGGEVFAGFFYRK
jgi:hypothetical protein